MIFISSSTVRHRKVRDSILELVSYGFKNIELSGGTEYYEGLEDDLVELRAKYNLKYLCHNYFPPPKENFVLNIASLNDEIYGKSCEHFAKAIRLSNKLGSKKFGIHAGFFIDLKLDEIGRGIYKKKFFDKEKSIERFCKGFNELKGISGDVELYIENNVFSQTNYETYKGEVPFMLCSSSHFKELKNKIEFNLLLDLAHLQVSSKSLNLNFDSEFSFLIKNSDYLHVSENNGLEDLNNPIKKDSLLMSMLIKQSLNGKDFTLEIYDDIKNVKESYKILMDGVKIEKYDM